MKKLLLALLMITSPLAALAEAPTPTGCAFNSIKLTEYAVFAAAMTDKDKPEFDKFIESEVTSNPNAEHLIHFLGGIAWNQRKVDPTDVGFSYYLVCMKHTGTTT